MDKMERTKERFESRFGMIMAMAGSAVGLGNLWRFPFLAAQNGGGAFIFVYLTLLLTICLPVLMTEITLGRKCRSNVTRVYDNLGAPGQGGYPTSLPLDSPSPFRPSQSR